MGVVKNVVTGSVKYAGIILLAEHSAVNMLGVTNLMAWFEFLLE